MINTVDPIEIAGLVTAGEINPLEAYVILKKMQSQTELAIKQIQDLAIQEGLKYGEKSFKAFDAKIEMRSSPATFKFSEAITQQEERLKLLKEQSKLGEFADPNTGEIIGKAVKIEGKQTISVSFK